MGCGLGGGRLSPPWVYQHCASQQQVEAALKSMALTLQNGTTGSRASLCLLKPRQCPSMHQSGERIIYDELLGNQNENTPSVEKSKARSTQANSFSILIAKI